MALEGWLVEVDGDNGTRNLSILVILQSHDGRDCAAHFSGN
jgi:hypothetical protein